MTEISGVPPVPDSAEKIKPVPISRGHKAVSLLTSSCLSPVAFTRGSISVVVNCAKLIHVCYKEKQCTITSATQSLEPAKMSRLPETVSFAHLPQATELAANVKISLLRMVPFVGTMLANHYIETKNVSGFINNPTFQQLVVDQGWTVQSNVYNSSQRLKINDPLNPDDETIRNAPATIRKYLESENPTCDDFRANFTSGETHPLINFARIPTRDGRIHDAQLLCAKGNTLSSPTVILYHGNSKSRSSVMPEAEQFMEKGYNVLLSSYAGDHTLGDRAQDNIPCSESAMRQDAEADFDFLRKLSVTSIGIYGYSLGGSQAANFAHILDLHNVQNPEQKISVPIMFLDKTFASATKVAGRFVENKKNSKILGYLVSALTKQQFKQEQQADQYKKKDQALQCDGLDTENKLAGFQSSDTFKQTSLIVLGAVEDNYMGGKFKGEYGSPYSMSLDLAKAGQASFANVTHIFQTRHTKTNELATHTTSFVDSNKEEIIGFIPAALTSNA